MSIEKPVLAIHEDPIVDIFSLRYSLTVSSAPVTEHWLFTDQNGAALEMHVLRENGQNDPALHIISDRNRPAETVPLELSPGMVAFIYHLPNQRQLTVFTVPGENFSFEEDGLLLMPDTSAVLHIGPCAVSAPVGVIRTVQSPDGWVYQIFTDTETAVNVSRPADVCLDDAESDQHAETPANPPTQFAVPAPEAHGYGNGPAVKSGEQIITPAPVSTPSPQNEAEAKHPESAEISENIATELIPDRIRKSKAEFLVPFRSMYKLPNNIGPLQEIDDVPTSISFITTWTNAQRLMDSKKEKKIKGSTDTQHILIKPGDENNKDWNNQRWGDITVMDGLLTVCRGTLRLEKKEKYTVVTYGILPDSKSLRSAEESFEQLKELVTAIHTILPKNFCNH